MIPVQLKFDQIFSYDNTLHNNQKTKPLLFLNKIIEFNFLQ